MEVEIPIFILHRKILVPIWKKKVSQSNLTYCWITWNNSCTLLKKQKQNKNEICHSSKTLQVDVVFHPQKWYFMLISMKTTPPVAFFPPKKLNWYLGNNKKSGQMYVCVLMGGPKSELSFWHQGGFLFNSLSKPYIIIFYIRHVNYSGKPHYLVILFWSYSIFQNTQNVHYISFFSFISGRRLFCCIHACLNQSPTYFFNFDI